MAKKNSKWYVTYWREYPIYEPAEGGYYYAGSQNIWTASFNTFRKARRYFAKAAAEFREYIVEGGGEERLYQYHMGGRNRYNEGSSIHYHSKYIGDGEGITITFGEPVRERIYEPYC